MFTRIVRPFFFLFFSISSNNTFLTHIFHHFHSGTKFPGHHFLCFSLRFGSLTLKTSFSLLSHFVGLLAHSYVLSINTYILITNLVPLDLFIVEVFWFLCTELTLCSRDQQQEFSLIRWISSGIFFMTAKTSPIHHMHIHFHQKEREAKHDVPHDNSISCI